MKKTDSAQKQSTRKSTSARGRSSLHLKRAERRLFSGGKVGRVLTRLGIDFRAFVSEYDRDDSRAPRETPLTDRERDAIRQFLKHRAISQLAQELGCSVASAHTRVARYALENRVSA